MRQLRAKILYIWIVATSVHRPWRMICETTRCQTSCRVSMRGGLLAATCPSFEVKGAAHEASPSLILGTSSSPSISANFSVID